MKRVGARAQDVRTSAVSSMPVLNGAPWSVKVVIWFLVWFGFPVVMTMLLFMVIIGYIPSPMLTTEQSMKEHREEMKLILDYIKIAARVQRQICRNTATSRYESERCND